MTLKIELQVADNGVHMKQLECGDEENLVFASDDINCCDTRTDLIHELLAKIKQWVVEAIEEVHCEPDPFLPDADGKCICKTKGGHYED